MFETVSANKVVFVESNPAWVKCGLSQKSLGPVLSPLLRFFVVETPAPGLSSRSIPVSEYGWDTPWRKPQYLNKKLKAASSNKSLYWSAAAVGDMEQALRNADLFDCAGIESKPFESAVFYDAKSNQTISLFYHLRNGFAHGRFCAFKSKGDIWFAIEDVAGKRKDDPAGDIKRLTARILIKNSTLCKWMICKWMKLIKAGPDIR